MVSKASSTPAFTIAIIRTPLSKYSCSPILPSYCGAVSKAVLPVSSRQVSSFLSSFAQSAIMPEENSPEIMSSMCFWNSGAMISFSCSDSA